MAVDLEDGSGEGLCENGAAMYTLTTLQNSYIVAA
jgi:hypothetical protein